MFTVKCALEEELKQTIKDDSLKYHKQHTNWPRTKIGNFIQCIGVKQNFQPPVGALFNYSKSLVWKL
jgi:hypothetical protein